MMLQYSPRSEYGDVAVLTQSSDSLLSAGLLHSPLELAIAQSTSTVHTLPAISPLWSREVWLVKGRSCESAAVTILILFSHLACGTRRYKEMNV